MRIAFPIVASALLLLVHALLLASSDPIVRRLHHAAATWPAGAPALRLVLLTDPHLSGPDATPRRLDRIVAAINRLQPDIVLLGGDFIGDRKLVTRQYGAADAVRPFAALRAAKGVFAVLGNHDHSSDPQGLRAAFAQAGVTVLDNDAVRIGPVAIGGVDDEVTGHADLNRVVGMLRRLGGTPILLSHSPDIAPRTPGWIGLILAGHTHCGQISLPLFGPVFTASRFGRRFACGVIRRQDQTMIVSAGVGTSIVPLRLGAPPDVWLIALGR